MQCQSGRAFSIWLKANKRFEYSNIIDINTNSLLIKIKSHKPIAIRTMKRSILPLLVISAIVASSAATISNNINIVPSKQTDNNNNNNNILLSRHRTTAEENNKRLLSINDRSKHRLFQSGKLSTRINNSNELEAEVDVQVDKVSPQYTNPYVDGQRTHKERTKGQSDDSSESESSKESEDTLLNVNVNVNVHNNGQDDSQLNERYNNGGGGSSVDDGQDWFDYDRQDTSSSSSDSSESSEDSSSEDSSSESSSESTSQDTEAGNTSWIGVQHNTATLSSTSSSSSSSSSDDIDECIKSGGTWSLNSWNRKLVSNPNNKNNNHNQDHHHQRRQQEQGQRMTKTQKAGKHSKTKWGHPPSSSSTDYFEWNNGWWYENNGWWYPANWSESGWGWGKSGKSGYYSKSSKSKSSKGWKCVHPPTPSTPSTNKPTSGEVPTKPSDKPTFAEIIETDKPTEEVETDKPTDAPVTPLPTEIVVSYKVCPLGSFLLPFLTYDICLICTCLYPSPQNIGNTGANSITHSRSNDIATSYTNDHRANPGNDTTTCWHYTPSCLY